MSLVYSLHFMRANLFTASFSSRTIAKTSNTSAQTYVPCPLPCPHALANTAFAHDQFKQGVPIEVVPFAYAKVLQNLHTIIGSPHASLRMAVKKAGPVVTDNANFIIDAPFTREYMKDPYLVCRPRDARCAEMS